MLWSGSTKGWCNNKDWGCVILREIDFLLKFCWSIPCLHPSWKVHTWIKICVSLNHRKKTKADGSRLIPRKHTETLVLLSVPLAVSLICTEVFLWLTHQKLDYPEHFWCNVRNWGGPLPTLPSLATRLSRVEPLTPVTLSLSACDKCNVVSVVFQIAFL